MPKPLSIAVAGLGRIGWNFHVKRLASHPDFRLVAVTDPLPDRREEARTTLGCVAYADYGEMLKRSKLDAVVVATPTHLHKPMVLEALRQGLHVLLEKPMAVNYTEARAIARAARRHGRVVTVYQPLRLTARFRQVQSVIRSKAIGRVVRAQMGFFSYMRRNDWQTLREFGGGMLNNYGAHTIDVVLQLIGSDIESVFCRLQRVAAVGDTEDAVKIVLQTRDGVIGDIDISQASAIKPYYLNVWGAFGAIRMDEESLRVRRFDPKDLPRRPLVRSLASAGRKYPLENIPFTEESMPEDLSFAVDVHADFARAIRRGVPPATRVEETLAVMKIIERCRKDAGHIAIMNPPARKPASSASRRRSPR